MALSPGTRLGIFEITALLGEGGFGQVYRAKDTKLEREVAIKVLPEAFAEDRERLARFEREAKLLAALDHPNIGALYEFREEHGVHFLVLQLIEGETLADRIARGSIPVREALPFFIQIAEALEAAHEQGIVHRDLKPGNVMVGKDAKAKVLDFGIGKTFHPIRTPSPTDATRASDSDPTKLTTEGSFLGTPSYMSPEQARGQEVDKRTDIWAFGCCLYKTLTGFLPFRGDTVVDTFNAILEREPDWDLLPANAPESVRNLLRRCLEKEPRRRLSGAGDIAIQLEESLRTLEARAAGGESDAFDELLAWRPEVGEPIPRREHWILESKLGEGGFGEVWLAAHEKTKSKRAFKFCFEADRVRGLRREVVLFRLLKESLGVREDIAHVLDWEFNKPPFFLETEYTEDGDLTQWAEEHGGIAKVPVETRLEVVAQAAVALGAAHSVGVLHKDIKPSNMLMAAGAEQGAPRVRLTDFGIGLITNPAALAEKGITAAGLTKTLAADKSSSGSGTRMYMAPELVEGRQPTTLSDIFALGVVLYQVVIGDFSRSVAPGWERDVEDPLLREDISACVDGNPERRLASATDLAERLRSLAQRRKEREAEEHAVEAAARGRRRRRQLVVGMLSVGILTIVLGALALLERSRASTETRLREKAVDLRNRAESERYVANIQLAKLRLGRGKSELAREALLACPEELRNWEWGYLVRQAWQDYARADARTREAGTTCAEHWRDATPMIVRTFPLPNVLDADINISRGVLAYGSTDSRVRIQRLRGGRDVLTTVRGWGIMRLRLSTDGALVALSGRDQNTKVWNSTTGSLLCLTEGASDNTPDFYFSPQSSYVVTTSYVDTLVTDLRSCEETARFTLPEGLSRHVAFREDESGFMIASGSGVELRTLPDATLVKSIQGPRHSDLRVRHISPNLQDIVSADTAGNLVVWSTQEGKEKFTIPNPADLYVKDLSVSSDASCLAVLYGDDLIMLWDMFSGDQLARLHGFAPLSTIRFVDNGNYLLLVEANVAVKLLAPSSVEAHTADVLIGHKGPVVHSDFSPDGAYVATASYDDSVILWDTRTKSAAKTLQGHKSGVFMLQFSPDGNALATFSLDFSVMVWDVETGEVLSQHPIDNGFLYAGELSQQIMWGASGMTQERFSPSGDMLLVPVAPDPSNPSLDHLTPVRPTYAAEGAQHPRVMGIAGFGAISSTGASALGFGQGGELGIVDLKTNQGVVVQAGPSIVYYADFSPDGQSIAVALSDSPATVLDSSSGEELQKLSGHHGSVKTIRFSPDGKLLVTASYDGTAKLWRFSDGSLLATLRGHSGFLINAEFSPDSSRVLTVSLDGSCRIWDLTGNELLRFRGAGMALHARWSPDGRRILMSFSDTLASSGIHDVRLVESEPWSEIRMFGQEDTPFAERLRLWRAAARDLDVPSPDGSRTPTAASDKAANVWDGPEQLVLRFGPEDADPAIALDWLDTWSGGLQEGEASPPFRFVDGQGILIVDPGRIPVLPGVDFEPQEVITHINGISLRTWDQAAELVSNTVSAYRTKPVRTVTVSFDVVSAVGRREIFLDIAGDWEHIASLLQEGWRGLLTTVEGEDLPETLLASLAEYHAAMTMKDLARLVAFFSNDYVSDEGGGKSAMPGYFLGIIGQGIYDNIEFVLDDCLVSIDGDVAKVGPVGLKGLWGAASFEYEMKKESDGVWRCIHSGPV